MLYNEEYNFFVRDDFDNRILYESKNYAPLFDGLEPGFNVLDIGAHIGTFSRLAAIKGAKSITCYEPYYPSFDILNHNIKNIPCKIKIFPLAVGPKDDKNSVLYVQDNPANNSQYRKGEPINVVQIKFDGILTVPYDVVKIDVEGAEYSLKFDLLPNSVKRLAVEMHTSGDIRQLHNNIIKLGFTSIISNIEKYIYGGRCVLGLYARGSHA